MLPATVSLTACGQPGLTNLGAATPDFSKTAGAGLTGLAAPRIAPPAENPADTVAGEAVVAFHEGVQAPESLPGAVRSREVAGLANTWIYRFDAGQYNREATTPWTFDTRISFAEPRFRFHAEGYPDGEDTTLYGLNRIHAPEAWKTATGTDSITVAVVDTGVDYRHPDLAEVVVKGPDLVNKDADPMDDFGHGTHCAGTIGAAANGSGIVGVAYGVKVLAIKVLDGHGSGTQETIAAGIDAAVKGGARIISLSLGGPDNIAMRDAVKRATAKGVLCVAAAGNNASPWAEYPGAIKEALCVGASDQDDQRSTFSNYGTYVDIVAPGTGIYSTYPGGGYRKMSGTSMATPHVAGAAALLLSHNPALTVLQLREALEGSGDEVGGFTLTPSAKRLNMEKALAAADRIAEAPTPAPNTATGPRPVISAIKVKSSASSATITWTTDLPTNGKVEYGDTEDYGAIALETGSPVRHHRIVLSGLRWHNSVHYAITGTTTGGASTTSRDRTFLPRALGILSLD